MEFKNRISNKFLGLILMLCITKACQGQLMCYVCDDCAKVSSQTPEFECNENFFNAAGSTSSSAQTTTERSTTTVSITTENDTSTDETTVMLSTEETTTIKTTTTLSSSSTTASKLPQSTENVTETTTDIIVETTTLREIETTSIHEDQPPSPPTVGPHTSTSAVPTPPTPDTIKPLDDVANLNNRTGAHNQHVNKDEVENVDVEHGAVKPYIPSAEFRVRQLRSVSDVSFHCFKVQATTANGTNVVSRGCSRVATNESVCGQWESQHPNEKMNKCFPCSRTKCNSSSALNVSITALFMTAVAIFLQRK